MSFKVEFSGQRRGGIKTKVTDLQDTDEHPVYLLSPGARGQRVPGASEVGAVLRLGWSRGLTCPATVVRDAGPSVAVRVFVLVAVAFAGAVIGSPRRCRDDDLPQRRVALVNAYANRFSVAHALCCPYRRQLAKVAVLRGADCCYRRVTFVGDLRHGVLIKCGWPWCSGTEGGDRQW